MQFQLVAPAAQVSPWVCAGTHIAFDSPGVEPIRCQFPALIEGGLVLVLEGRFFAATGTANLLPLPPGFVSSARAQPLVLYRTPRLRCIGLRLHPAGTIGLLQASPTSLPHQFADAADVFGPDWSRLQAQVHAANSVAQQLALLMAFAAQRLRDERHRQRVRRAWQLQHAALRLASPQEAVGLATRQFERVFSGTFGLRPKLFQRVGRVESLLRDALASGRTDAGLALQHGFYDQSH
ncbi:MAG: hypothetical protein EOO25_11610, partial [Comamonadaceae bacterium]